MSSARDTYDGSAAQSQHYAAETLVEHAQLPRTGAFHSSHSFAPRTELRFPQPLGPLNSSQYPQLPPVVPGPVQDGRRGSINDTRMLEVGAAKSPYYTRPPTILHPDHQVHQHGFSPASDAYGNMSQISGNNLISSIPQRSSEQVSTPEFLDAGQRDDGSALAMAASGAHDGYPNKEENSGGHLAWAELKTKAGKERKRLPLACIACRRKKIRCSGEKPACKHCFRSRNPCIYKVSTRKATPRTDYFSMLDKRLKRMEERVIKIIPNKSTSTLPRASVKPNDHGIESKTQHAKKRNAQEAFDPDWSERAYRSQLPAQLSRGSDTEGLKDLTEGLDKLPSSEIQEHLAEVFFDCLYGQSYHLLHKPSFMQRLKTQSVPPVLVLAVCAVSARFSTHPQIDSEPHFLRGEEWAQPAREIALKYYDEPNITILTVYLLLGLHEFGTCQGGRSWMLGGMAVRMAFALQLNKDLDQDESSEQKISNSTGKSLKLSFIDQEIRRRTMFACFLMDRFNSSGADRATFISERNINVQLPIRERNFQMGIPGKTEGLEQDLCTVKASDKANAHESPHDKATGSGNSDRKDFLSDVEENTHNGGETQSTGNVGPPDRSKEDDPQSANQPKGNMGVAAYIIRGVALWHRILQYMNLGGRERDRYPIWDAHSQFLELKDQAHHLVESLPSRLQNTEENLHVHAAEKLGNQFVFLHMICNQVIMCLYRFAIPSSPSGKVPHAMPEHFFNDAAPIAIEAATNLTLLLGKAREHNVVAPFAGYCAFMSSTVHIWGVFSKNPALAVSSKQHLASNMRYLTKMKNYWGMFHYLGENLRDIYRQYEEASQKDPDLREISSGDYRVFQYGDWFSRYPHGVSKSDYIDPAGEHAKDRHINSTTTQESNLQSVDEYFQREPSPTEFKRQRMAARKLRSNTNRKDGNVPTKGGQAPENLQEEQDQWRERTEQQEQQRQGESPHHQEATNPHFQQNPPPAPLHVEAEVPQLSAIRPTTLPSQTIYTPSHPTFPQSYSLAPQSPNLAANFLNKQLDRQLIYGAYSNIDPNAPPSMDAHIPCAFNSIPSHHNMNTLAPAPPDHIRVGAGSNIGGGWDTMDTQQQALLQTTAASDYGNLGDNAWFTPFNLNPPPTMDEGVFGRFWGDGGGLDEYHDGC